MISHRRLLGAMLAMVFVAASAGVLGTVALGAQTEPSPGASCPGYDSVPKIAEFHLDSAKDYHRFLPAMGRTPELDVDSSPAYIVIYSADVGVVTAGQAGYVKKSYHDVVCVVQSDGAVNVYSDVSRQQWSRPSKP